MKITLVEPIHLRLPEVTDACDGTQDSLVILVHTDEGITGIGEVDSSPTVIKAIVEAPLSHQICNGLANLIEGENPLDIGRLCGVDKPFLLEDAGRLNILKFFLIHGAYFVIKTHACLSLSDSKPG